jgi:hypothetical protein
MRRIKLKWKIYLVIGVIAAAIALMAVLIALDNGNTPPAESGVPGTSADTPVQLPTIDIPLN